MTVAGHPAWLRATVGLLACLSAGCGPTPYLLAALGLTGGKSGGGANAPPSVSVETPSRAQTGGVGAIAFILADAEGDPTTVSFEFAVGASDFRPATPRPTAIANSDALSAPPNGASYTFAWDTAADGVPNSGAVVFAITAGDASGKTTRAVTGPFAVVNHALALNASGLAIGAHGLPALPSIEALRPGNAGPRYAFDFTPLVRDGLAPFLFTLASAPPLPGLALDPTSGKLTGAPTRSGDYRVTLTVEDATPSHVSLDLDLAIAPGVRIAAGALPPATPGAAYAERLLAAQGTSPYTFALKGGALPVGLALAADGRVSGTAPASPVLASFTVAATDATGFTASREVKLRVADPRPIAAATIVTPANVGSDLDTYLVADLDGDGRDDLLRVGVGTQMFFDALLSRAKPDGTFGGFADPVAVAIPAVDVAGNPVAAPGSFFTLVQAADLDGDGRPEIVLLPADFSGFSGELLILKNVGVNPLQYEAHAVTLSALAGLQLGEIVTGDFDGDTRPDLAFTTVSTTGSKGGGTTTTTTVHIVLDPLGAQTIVQGPSIAFSGGERGTPPATQLVAGDFDGDGVAELHFGDTIYSGLAFDARSSSYAFTRTMSFPGAPEIAGKFEDGLPDEIAQLAPDAGNVPSLSVFRVSPSLGTSALAGSATYTAQPLAPGPGPVSLKTSPFFPMHTGSAPSMGIVASTEVGDIFLATVTPSAARGIDPPIFDGPHAVQGGILLRLLGAAHVDGAGAPDRFVFGGPLPFGSAGDRLLVLTRDGPRLDGPDATSGFFGFNARLLSLGGSSRPDLVLASLGGISVMTPDAVGRLGPPRSFLPAASTVVADEIQLFHDRGETHAVAVISPSPLAGPTAPSGLGFFNLPLAQPAVEIGEAPYPSALSSAFGMQTGDFDGDGRDELAFISQQDLTAYVVATDGLSTATVTAKVFTGVLPFGLFHVADLDRDGYPDLVFDTNANALLTARSMGDGGFAPPLLQPVATARVGNGTSTLTVLADLNEDDQLDALTLGIGPLAGPPLFNLTRTLDRALNRDGFFGPPERVATFTIADVSGIDALPFATYDATLDGRVSVVLVDQASGSDAIIAIVLVPDSRGQYTVFARLDYGLGTMSSAVVPGLFEVVVGDLDGDGIDDVVIQTDLAIVTLFGDGRGGFRRADSAPLPGAPP